MADIVIFYELPERELNNANLLKAEFERRGYTVEFKDYWDYFGDLIHPVEETPKLIITHSGYDNTCVERFTMRFKHRVDKMLNMRYEQVMSKRVTNSTLHYPRETVKDMCHVCWSDEIKQDMINHGISEKRLGVTGDIKTDFSHKKFDSFYRSKNELAKEFNLDPSKEWVLFISSFTFNENDVEEKIIRFNNNMEDGKYLQKWDIKSKKILMEWVKRFINDHPDKEFIYRPHPSEHIITKDYELLKLEEDFDNFHYIKKYAIQEWVRPCEFLNTISSTSIVDVYLQKKQCNILRPVPLDPDFDNPLFKHAKFITNYDDFEQNNLEKGNVFPISDEDVSKYYYFGDKLAYENICDFAEKIINDDSYKADFYPNGFKFLRLKFIIKKAFSLPKAIPKALKSIFADSKDSNTQTTTSIYEKNAEKIKEIVFNEDV